MTSPNIDKPVAGPEGFDTVHSRGSSFGQGLTEGGIRDLLSGPGQSNPFTNLVNEAGNIITEIGNGIYNAAADLFGWDHKPQSPLWEEFSAEAFKALEPIHSLADQALDEAGVAQGKAEDLSGQLTEFVEVDYANAIAGYDIALENLSESVGAVSELIPEVTGAAEAVTEAEQAVAAAMDNLVIEINRTQDLADQVDRASEEYQDQVAAANTAAKRVEDATSVYSSKVAAAEQLLEDMEEKRSATASAAQEVQGLVGTPEWDEAVTGFVYWQDQLNTEQSEFNSGVQGALAALEMVQDKDSEFNKSVAAALAAQEDINSKQGDFNDGVTAALAALAMVDEYDSEFNKGVRSAISALETFANLQDDVNKGVEASLEELSGIADLSKINWQTTTDYMKQNSLITRAHTETLALHENQLTWINDTKVRQWAFDASGTTTHEPWVSVRISRNIGADRVDFTALGSWQGRIALTIYYKNDATDFHDWIILSDEPSERWTFWTAYAAGPEIRNVDLTIYPAWGNRKREYLLMPDPLDGREDSGFQRTTAYDNDVEGRAIVWSDTDDAVRFPYIAVKATEIVWVWDDVSSGYIRRWPSGHVPKNVWIRALSDNMVKFTEYEP